MSPPQPLLAEAAAPAYPDETPTLPRLLAGIPARGQMSLEQHLAVHGPLPLIDRRRRRSESALIEQIDQAGLRGRGGGAFPMAAKMRAVAGSRRRPVVVVNGAEGEPASLKDRTLMQTVPHLVLDGGELAARAIGADELIVGVRDSARASLDGVARAIAERGASLAHTHATAVPGNYVAGQESALVNHLNGGPARPTFTPPLPFEQGVRRRPTLVSNVETLAHVALIARHGPRWFRQLGTPSEPGSALVTLTGPVAAAGVYEIEHGAPLTALIEAAGGTTAPIRAALLGGYGGAWVGGEYLHRLALSDEHLAPHGATLGASVVALLSESACPVAETARVARWLSGQSAGQCGPCIHGLDALAAVVEEIAAGAGPADAGQRVGRLAALVRRRGACGHPDGAANFLLSALDVFAAELAEHARHGPCHACALEGELPL